MHFFFQPTARPPGNDFSYRRMDGGPHMNGGVLQEDSVPMHLTNGYADNMLTNVCPHIYKNFCNACQLFSAVLVNLQCFDMNTTYYSCICLRCFVCHNNALQKIKYYWL